MYRYVINIFLFSILIFGLIFPQLDYRSNHSFLLTGEEYITGEDGVPRMSINIWGHVKNPGTYLVYDGIDLLTCLSMAGGPNKGADLSKISIISDDGKSKKYINLNKLIEGSDISSISLSPYDTIHINESFSSYVFSRSGFISLILQLTSLIYAISIN